eukprot:TRINITY_DN14001_c0_g1_i1.p2 TRINITY_DN14001_c0_g1~~TRINITY_DN14001_c0_g1_i1.p2  ORF type:complete len:114 (-),score=21.95 TRINITY_DN14001_c0_g1_i1:138-440(-)
MRGASGLVDGVRLPLDRERIEEEPERVGGEEGEDGAGARGCRAGEDCDGNPFGRMLVAEWCGLIRRSVYFTVMMAPTLRPALRTIVAGTNTSLSILDDFT